MYYSKLSFFIVGKVYSISVVVFGWNLNSKSNSVRRSSENSFMTSRRRRKLEGSLIKEVSQRNVREKVDIDALIESFLQNDDPKDIDSGSEETTPVALLSTSPSPSSGYGGYDVLNSPSSDSVEPATTTTAETVSTNASTGSITLAPTLIYPANNKSTRAPFRLPSSNTSPIRQHPTGVDFPFASSPFPLMVTPTLAPTALNVVSTTSAVPTSRPVPGEAQITVVPVPSHLAGAGDGKDSSISISSSGNEGPESTVQQNSDTPPSSAPNEDITTPTVQITTAPSPSVAVVRPTTFQTIPQQGGSTASTKTAAPVVSSSPITTISPIANDVKSSPTAIANRNPLPVLAVAKPLDSENVPTTPNMVKNVTASPMTKKTITPATITPPKASNAPVIRPTKTTPPVGVLQGKPMTFIISPSYTVYTSQSPSPSPLPSHRPSAPTASNSSHTPGLTPTKILANVTSPSMVAPIIHRKVSKPSIASFPSLTSKPKSITTISSSPWPTQTIGTSPMISPSKASHPVPPIGTIEVSSSPWPNPTYVTAVSLSPEQQLVLNRNRLPNNHDPTNVDQELLPMQVSYLKIDKVPSQPKSSRPGINTHTLLFPGIFLVGAFIFLFTYRYAQLR